MDVNAFVREQSNLIHNALVTRRDKALGVVRSLVDGRLKDSLFAAKSAGSSHLGSLPSSKSICLIPLHRLLDQRHQVDQHEQLSKNLSTNNTTDSQSTQTKKNLLTMDFSTPASQLAHRACTPSAPPRRPVLNNRMETSFSRLPTGTRFLEDLPERETGPPIDPNSHYHEPAPNDEHSSSQPLDLNKPLPPSPAFGSPRRFTTYPQATSVRSTPQVPHLPRSVLEAGPERPALNRAPSFKILYQDPGIPAGQVHLGTRLISLAEAQAQHEARKAEYLRTSLERENSQRVEPPQRPTLKQVAAVVSTGLSRFASNASKQSVARKPVPALRQSSGPPPERTMVGSPDRGTRWGDMYGYQYTPSGSRDDVSGTPSEAPPSEEQTSPPPPRQHQIPRKPVATRRQGVMFATAEEADGHCGEHQQERGEGPDRIFRIQADDWFSQPHRLPPDPRRPTTQDSDLQELFDSILRVGLFGDVQIPAQRIQGNLRWSWEADSPAEDKTLGRGGDIMHTADAVLDNHDSVYSQDDGFQPAHQPYHNSLYTAFVNEEVNRLYHLEEAHHNAETDDDRRNTTFVDTRVHDKHTSFVVTQFKGNRTVESHHYRQPREVSDDGKAMAVWNQLSRGSGGVVSPVLRSGDPSSEAPALERNGTIKSVREFVQRLRDDEGDEPD